MITIIPSIEVMKASIDNNIQGSGANIRRIALDVATDLKTLSDTEILIEGIMYERVIEPKLLPEQKPFFENICKIDNSAKGISGYDIIKAIKFVANSESNSRKVIIVSENERDFESICCECIICLTPAKFIEVVERAKTLHKMKIFSTLDDSLMAILFTK